MLANKTPNRETVMPPLDESKMITTPEFLKAMEALRVEIKAEITKDSAQQASDRHRTNGVTHAVINDVFLRTVGQDTVLREQTAILERIEACLLGDAKYQKIGLITTVTGIDKRLAEVEEAVKMRTKAAILVFGVLGVLGTVITWFKATSFFKFLSSP